MSSFMFCKDLMQSASVKEQHFTNRFSSVVECWVVFCFSRHFLTITKNGVFFSLLNDSTTQVAFVGVVCVVFTDGVLFAHWVLNISIRSLQLMDESSMLL
jgi:hypothetical protein